MNISKIASTLGLICFCFIQVFAGGDWPQPKGKGYFKVSQWWLIADQHYTDVGQIDPNLTSGIFNSSLYAEYGLSQRLTGVVYFPFFSRNYFNNQVSATTGEILKAGEAINSIGDTDISFRYALTKPGSSIALSAAILLGLPLGENKGGSENALQTGDGEFNQMLQLGLGKSFGTDKIGIYTKLSVGVNNRTNDFSDEFRYGAELGFGILNSKLWLVTRLTGVESFQNGKLASEVVNSSIFANNAEFTSIGFEANYYLTKKIGLSAGYATAFRGQIIYAAPSYSVGVFYDMK
ncbi:MAG: hypothetical protein IPL46_04210 [Saprospiraceae bacterium]|nr:hypothetical protein [Saprospiraceae bacterium]